MNPEIASVKPKQEGHSESEADAKKRAMEETLETDRAPTKKLRELRPIGWLETSSAESAARGRRPARGRTKGPPAGAEARRFHRQGTDRGAGGQGVGGQAAGNGLPDPPPPPGHAPKEGMDGRLLGGRLPLEARLPDLLLPLLVALGQPHGVLPERRTRLLLPPGDDLLEPRPHEPDPAHVEVEVLVQ